MAQKTGLWGLWECAPPKRPEKYSGKWVDWHINGTKQFEGIFLKGKPTGRHTYWHENGGIHKDGMFINGIPIGKHYIQGKNGNMIFKRIYHKTSAPTCK